MAKDTINTGNTIGSGNLEQAQLEPTISDLDLMLDKSDICNYVIDESEFGNKKLSKLQGAELIFSNVGTIYDSIVKGETITDICNKYQISRTTWYALIKKSRRFAQMIETAKQEQVENVKASLIGKTMDKYVIAEKVLPNGEVVQYRKFVPSDTNAIKFFLLNKASDEYKEKQEVEITKTEYVIDIIDNKK